MTSWFSMLNVILNIQDIKVLMCPVLLFGIMVSVGVTMNLLGWFSRTGVTK